MSNSNGSTHREVILHLQRGIEFINNGDKNRAKFCFDQAISLEPHNEDAFLWRGFVEDDPFKAVIWYERVLEQNPTNPMGRSYLAAAKARCAEISTLAEGASIEEFWHKSKRHEVRKLAAIPHLGNYLLELGRISKVQLDSALAIHTARSEAGSKQKLGELLVELGYITKPALDEALASQFGDYNYFFKD